MRNNAFPNRAPTQYLWQTVLLTALALDSLLLATLPRPVRDPRLAGKYS